MVGLQTEQRAHVAFWPQPDLPSAKQRGRHAVDPATAKRPRCGQRRADSAGGWLGAAADGYERRFWRGDVREEIVSPGVHDDEGRGILDPRPPNRLQSQPAGPRHVDPPAALL